MEPCSDPQTSPLGPQKVKNDPKIKSNSNVRIQGIIENEKDFSSEFTHRELKFSWFWSVFDRSSVEPCQKFTKVVQLH